MKTTLTFFQHLIKQPCEKLFCWLSLRRSSLLASLSPAQKSLLSQVFAPVSLAIRAIRLAASSEYKTYTAFVIIALGPLAEVAYRLFDASAGDPLSYWNTYYFLNAVGDDIATLLYVTGFYLLLPELSRLKFIAIIPASYKFGHICWMPFVNSNADYHQFTPIAFLMLGVACALWWFVIADHVMHLCFHKKASKISTAKGALACKEIPDSSARAIALHQLQLHDSLK